MSNIIVKFRTPGRGVPTHLRSIGLGKRNGVQTGTQINATASFTTGSTPARISLPHPCRNVRSMSTEIHNPNKACCSIPPVQSDYTPKGTFESFGDFKRVYVTGPQSTNAIVCVYDIFGYFPQTQQGADIIASTLKTRVFMPDFFEPVGAFPLSKFPPKDDQTKAELQAFFGGIASPLRNSEKLIAFGNWLKLNGVSRIGVYGFCWGGKVTMISGAESTPFDAVSIVHPAMLSVQDAEKLTVPLAIYPSHDEPEEEYNQIMDVISKKPFASKSDGHYYSNMFHGWAAARGDLTNEENKQAYEDVYGKLCAFFGNVFA